jgi:Zn-finger nucleic acid-binding protein
VSGCPACDDDLIVFELGGVEIDHCVGCRGTWLDGGELEMIVEFAGAESGVFTRALDAARAGEKSDRRCPRCSRKMRLIHLGETPTIDLDRCPTGHGLWFDSGEMKQLVDLLDDDGVASEKGASERGAISRFFAELYHHEFQEASEKGQET